MEQKLTVVVSLSFNRKYGTVGDWEVDPDLMGMSLEKFINCSDPSPQTL